MAIYSTFFLAELSELLAGFPGWKPRLAAPVMRTWFNPFTKEEMTCATREPEWEDFDPELAEVPEYRVIQIEGDYNAYLEQRLPAFVQSRPHWCTKNLTTLEIEPLVAAVTTTTDVKLETALYAHPALGCLIAKFPNDFVAVLKATDDSALHALAEQWAARMSTPEYTHSVGGERVYDDWLIDDALELLKSIAALAKRQRGDQSMYLLTEP